MPGTTVILVLALLMKNARGLDSEKTNKGNFSEEVVTNQSFGFEDEDFTLGDSTEQLPCSDLRGYAFHNETKKCWPVGAKGPCPDLMKFYADPEHEGYGDCDCIPMKNCIGRPRTYWPDTGRCYFIYSKGPCPVGSWLVFNKNRKPECQRNLCGKQIKTQKNLDFVFTENGQCYQTGSQAFCEKGETVYISSSTLQPKCYTSKPVCRFLLFTAKTLSCRPGSKFDVSGRCDDMWEMNNE